MNKIQITTNHILKTVLGIIIILSNSCESFIEVDAPITELGTEAVFTDDNTARATMNGVYISMMDNFGHFANKNTTLFAGLSSDEYRNHSVDAFQKEFYENSLTPSNSSVGGLWKDIYKTIYHVNAILEGLEHAERLSQDTVDQIQGEALFIRAFAHFYAMQFFGTVPYIKSTDFQKNSMASPEPTDAIYNHIINDLTMANSLLSEDYIASGGDRIHPNKFTSLALLARVSLYMANWADAELYADMIIGASDRYALETDLSQVFHAGSTEAIWQIQPVIAGLNTIEGYSFSCCVNSNVSLSQSLQDSFETGDQRWSHWVGSQSVGLETLFYPRKYKILFASTYEEYYMVFRLAEIYLIRAEARAYQNNLEGGYEDLNRIRNRSQLGSIAVDSQSHLIRAIMQERRIELFSEWGHRWFDLKRTGITATLEDKPFWEVTDFLYPIPETELLLNPNLEQVPGY